MPVCVPSASRGFKLPHILEGLAKVLRALGGENDPGAVQAQRSGSTGAYR